MASSSSPGASGRAASVASGAAKNGPGAGRRALERDGERPGIRGTGRPRLPRPLPHHPGAVHEGACREEPHLGVVVAEQALGDVDEVR